MSPSTDRGSSTCCTSTCTSCPAERTPLSGTWVLYTSFVRRLCFLFLLVLLFSFANLERAYAQANPGCTTGACVSSGTRLAGVDSGDSELLDGLLGSLLGSDLDVSLVDWQSLANADLTLGDL